MSAMVSPSPVRDESLEINLWKHRIRSRLESTDYVEWEKAKSSAKEFYAGRLADKGFVDEWQGDVVELNMWRRILVYFVDALYSNNPNFVTRPRQGVKSSQALKNASAVEAQIKYVWDETEMDDETRRTLKDAYFGNVSGAKWVWDQERELPTLRWIVGKIIVDPEAHGSLNRANWVAEECTMSVMRILQDGSIPVEKRQRYAQQLGIDPSSAVPAMLDRQKKVYYVISREGANPVSELEVFTGQKRPKKKLLVFVEDSFEYLYEAEDPYPWLNDDEYPIALLRIDEQPGEFIGSPMWSMLQSMISSLNWLMSYHLTDMRKKATDLIGVNKNIIKNPKSLGSKAHMDIVECDGDPRVATAPLDIGKTRQGTTLESANAVMTWLDRLAGTSEIVRGESSGRKTAEEARYLQQNSSLILKGPGVSLDKFIGTCVRYLGLSSLHYLPQFSRFIGVDGSIMTRVVQQGIDPMSGQPVQQIVEAPVDPSEAKGLGAVEFKDDFGKSYGFRDRGTQVSMGPMGPVFQHQQAGKVVKRGVDRLGDDVAVNWPTGPLEEIKRDLVFTFEAGSTRAEWRYDQQQAAFALLQTLGPIYQQAGFADQLYELLLVITKSSPLPDTDRLIPDREQFVSTFMGMMQAQQQAQQMQAAAQQQPAQEKQSDDSLKKEELAMKYELEHRRLDIEEKKVKQEKK